MKVSREPLKSLKPGMQVWWWASIQIDDARTLPQSSGEIIATSGAKSGKSGIMRKSNGDEVAVEAHECTVKE